MKNKTIYTEKDIKEFIDSFVDNESKKEDSFRIIELMQNLTQSEPKMWGPTIIGFGNYHYKYASGHEGDAPIVAFAPRKTALTFYVYSDTEKSKVILEKLGKFKKTKGCIYVKRLSDIDVDVLKELCLESIKYINEHYKCSCKM